MEVTIEKATFDDFKAAVDLTRRLEDWEHSYDDYHVYKKAFGEENVTFLAAKNEVGEMVGFAALLKYTSNISTIGTYIVYPDYRAHGIGPKIFEKLIEDSVREGRNMGLNANSRMAEKYEKRYGFDKRHSFDIDIIAITQIKISRQTIEQWKDIVDLDQIDMNKLVEFDRTITCGLDRDGFVRAWTTHPVGRTKVALDKNKQIVGYAVGRQIYDTLLVIAPIYAADDTMAKKLFLSLIPEQYTGKTVVFASSKKSDSLARVLADVAQVNPDCTLASRFTKAAPKVDIDRVYGIANADLGFV